MLIPRGTAQAGQFANQESAPIATRALQVPVLLERIIEHIGQLESTLINFEQRLSPIVSPVGPTTASEAAAKEREPPVPLVAALANIEMAILATDRRLCGLMSRLEL